MKKFLLIILFVIPLFGHCQDKCDHINFVLLIDDQVISSNGQLLIKDSIGQIIDSIPFEGNVGTLNFTEGSYKKFLSLSQQTKVVIQFKYRQLTPKNIEHLYEKQMEVKWLHQNFVVFRIYNYDNPQNMKIFVQKHGYGIELETASFGTVLPRRSRTRQGK